MRVFTQTSAPTVCGRLVGCSGAALANQPRDRECVEGGTPDGAAGSSLTSNTTGQAAVMLQLEGILAASWEAGDWVVRFNLTTANSLITLQEIHVCRFNSSCVNQGSVGSLTGIGEGWGSTGVKTHTITGSADVGGVFDNAYIIAVFDAGGVHGNQAFSITYDQDIDSPLLLLPEGEILAATQTSELTGINMQRLIKMISSGPGRGGDVE